MSQPAASKPPAIEPILLDRRAAAAFLGISPSKLWELTAAGTIPAQKRLGSEKCGKVLYLVATLKAWAEIQD